MKKLLLLFVIFLSFPFPSSGQTGTKSYKTWITLGGGDRIKGKLYQTLDSSIVIANTFNSVALKSGKFTTVTVDYTDIYQIEAIEDYVAGKNSWKGALAGAAIGFSSGALLGLITGESSDGVIFGNTLGFYVLGYGICLGLIGIPVGAGISTIITTNSIKVQIPINGNFSLFSENRKKLKGYSYLH